MAYQNERVLLGIIDEQVTDKYRDDVSPETSKIGGLPDWWSPSIALPKCSLCGLTLVLVTQLYCPLQGSQYHRTLYVFACISRKCWNKSESWVVLRCQRRWEEVGGIDNSCSERVTQQEQWLEGQDEWAGSETTDDNSRFLAGRMVDPNLNVRLMENLHLENRGQISPEGAVGMFEATADVEPADEGTVTIETLDVTIDRQRWRDAVSPVGSAQANRQHPSIQQLDEWFLSVVDEAHGSRTFDYEMSLLLDYQRREGINLNEVERKLVDNTGGDSEFYEQAAPKHGDRYFHKSTKQLQLCPNQLIRYSRGPTPFLLFLSGERRDPTQCKHCRGKMVCELQLLPTLVNVLKADGVEGPVVEFGTVVINTCQSSCWRDSDTVLQEVAVVYPDIYDSLIRHQLCSNN